MIGTAILTIVLTWASARTAEVGRPEAAAPVAQRPRAGAAGTVLPGGIGRHEEVAGGPRPAAAIDEISGLCLIPPRRWAVHTGEPSMSPRRRALAPASGGAGGGAGWRWRSC